MSPTLIYCAKKVSVFVLMLDEAKLSVTTQSSLQSKGIFGCV